MCDYHVLLVDDEADFLEKLLKRMKLRKVIASAATNGKDALAFLSEKPVDVVVLDVRMSGMDGIEVLIEIKKRHPFVEVIMLTGHANMGVAMEGMQLGAFDYLMKPVDFDELLYKIQDAHKKKMLKEAEEKAQSTKD